MLTSNLLGCQSGGITISIKYHLFNFVPVFLFVLCVYQWYWFFGCQLCFLYFCFSFVYVDILSQYFYLHLNNSMLNIFLENVTMIQEKYKAYIFNCWVVQYFSFPLSLLFLVFLFVLPPPFSLPLLPHSLSLFVYCLAMSISHCGVRNDCIVSCFSSCQVDLGLE